MKKGVALLLAICAIFILLFVGIILILLARRETGLVVSLKHRQEAFNYAESGIDRIYNAFYGFGKHSDELFNYSLPPYRAGLLKNEGYDANAEYLYVKEPVEGFQQGPRFLPQGAFAGFYYHAQSVGFKGKAKRTIHVTLRRIFPVEK